MSDPAQPKRTTKNHLVVDTNARIKDIGAHSLAGRTFVDVCGVVCEGPRVLV